MRKSILALVLSAAVGLLGMTATNAQSRPFRINNGSYSFNPGYNSYSYGTASGYYGGYNNYGYNNYGYGNNNYASSYNGASSYNFSTPYSYGNYTSMPNYYSNGVNYPNYSNYTYQTYYPSGYTFVSPSLPTYSGMNYYP